MLETEPNANERERLLGYTTGATAAPGLTEADRFRLTGQRMDANQLRGIFFTALALDDMLPSLLRRSLQPYDVPCQACTVVQPLQQPAIPNTHWATYPLSPDEWGTDDLPAIGYMGASMLRAHSWSPGEPLGIQPTGLRWPLHLPQTCRSHGLGFTSAATSASSSSSPSTSSALAADCAVAGGGVSPEAHPSIYSYSPIFLCSSIGHLTLPP